ncbi:MAG: hypothetical protein ACKOWF_16090 [Chloroflexota bacterium]
MKLRCPSKVVFGHLYAAGDGEIALEVLCRARECQRPGMFTVHLFDAAGGCLTRHVPKP